MPARSAPPPVKTMPCSMRSDESSGGVRSSVTLTASTIAWTGSSMALRICSVEMIDGLGQSGDEVATADLGAQLLFERVGRTELDLDLLRGSFTERQLELFLHVRDQRLVEFVAADADRLTRHDATE